MAVQKTPHTQSQQNVEPEQSHLEPQELPEETDSEADQQLYQNANGAETGTNRAPREVQTRSQRHDVEPQTAAQEGSLSTRTPETPHQGITSHSAEEESSRQKKVVSDRPDAEAGVNRTSKRPA